MNKLVSVALAGVVAVAAIAATAGSASAGGWKPGWQPGGNPGWQQQHHARPYYPGPRPYNPGPAIVAGAILGLTLGALATQPYYSPYPPPPPPVEYYPTYAPGYYSSEHFNWCAATYDTYNSATDTWTDFRGVVRRCVGP